MPEIEVSDRDIAWAAGLFEGEGTIVVQPPIRSIRVALAMTDQDVVRRFHAIVGVGAIHFKRQDPYKPCYQWETRKRKHVESVLNKFLPLFGERRKSKARQALQFSQTHPLTYGRGITPWNKGAK